MEIICDTNIWYHIGRGTKDISWLTPEDKLMVTFISLDEIVRSGNLLKIETGVRDAIQAMFKYSKEHPYFRPPFYHIKWLEDQLFDEMPENAMQALKATELIASGESIAVDKRDQFAAMVKHRKWNCRV